jgi:hypothetical protein
MKLTETDISMTLTNLVLHICLPFYYFHSLVISIPNAETRAELETQVRVNVLPSLCRIHTSVLAKSYQWFHFGHIPFRSQLRE